MAALQGRSLPEILENPVLPLHDPDLLRTVPPALLPLHHRGGGGVGGEYHRVGWGRGGVGWEGGGVVLTVGRWKM